MAAQRLQVGCDPGGRGDAVLSTQLFIVRGIVCDWYVMHRRVPTEYFLGFLNTVEG